MGELLGITERIPILLIGYCRPLEFTRIINEIELLNDRKVHVSLDGPTSGMESLASEVLEIALQWRETSRHEVTIHSSKENLGLFTHFQSALQYFFTNNKVGLVLEDDMEFQPEFVDYLDSKPGQSSLFKYWSVVGHNPKQAGILDKNINRLKISFFESEVHTIWGWAASNRSIEFYLRFIELHAKNLNYLDGVIEAFSKRITMDPFLRRDLASNWRGKIARAVSLEKPNWDNYWVLAGWDSGKKSLMPIVSLTRENPDAYGYQTHQRVIYGSAWDTRKHSGAEFPPDLLKTSKRNQIRLLEVWGTTRKKSWKQLVARLLQKIK